MFTPELLALWSLCAQTAGAQKQIRSNSQLTILVLMATPHQKPGSEFSF